MLLAAGAGIRMGQPKATVMGADNLPWVVSSARTLVAAGCAETVVVIGAAADEVRELLADEPVTMVESASWQDGMGSSLRAGLKAIGALPGDAVLIHLVDLPDVGADVVRRLLDLSAPDVLARACYGNGPGHPVLLGRQHWQAIADETAGDSGARHYLQRHHVLDVDCSDLATGTDVDDARSMLGT